MSSLKNGADTASTPENLVLAPPIVEDKTFRNWYGQEEEIWLHISTTQKNFLLPD